MEYSIEYKDKPIYTVSKNPYKAKRRCNATRVKDIAIKVVIFVLLTYVLVDFINIVRKRTGFKFFRDEEITVKPAFPPTFELTKNVVPEKPVEDSGRACTQAKRQARLEAECERMRKEGKPLCHPWTLEQKLTGRAIYVDDVNKVLYCEVPKAASSSWKALFLTLAGKVQAEDFERDYLVAHQSPVLKASGFRLLESFPPPQRLYRIENYFKFMVARNPLNRITSAYEDKILNTEWYHLYVGKWIMRHYRKNPSQEALDTGHNVTFNEFVQFITNDKELKVHQLHDHQWHTMEGLCCPCLYKYDYIAKTETLAQDAKYLLRRIFPGLNVTLPHLHTVQGQKASEKVRQKLGRLDAKERNALLNLYTQDNDLFDYDLDENDEPRCGDKDGCC